MPDLADDSLSHDVLREGDPRLLVRCEPLLALDDRAGREARALMSALTVFRARHGFGRGIAAPQLGFDLRMLALDLGAGPFPLYNPEISWRSEETFELWDDCFSLPDKLVRVRRHRSISVRFRDEKFRARHWERLPPELAELLQHEIDHLDGVLMTARAAGPDAIRPAGERARLIDAARVSHRLSHARIAEAASHIDPLFLDTPQFVSEPLYDLLGCRITLKVETMNPIRSFKGRGAEYALSRLVEAGARGPLVCASAGNFGQALAYSCRRRKIPLTVYAARDANPLKVERMRALGARVELQGDDFDQAKDVAKRHATQNGEMYVEDGLLGAIAEGAGTIAVELAEHTEPIDAVFVPLGNGSLVNGMGTWLKHSAPNTRVIAVCAKTAPSMALSWQARKPIAAPSATIADGIAVRVPIPEAVGIMPGTVDEVMLVSDDAMLAAMRALFADAGLVVEPAGAAGVAAIAQRAREFTGQRVATVLTGGNLTQEQIREWIY